MLSVLKDGKSKLLVDRVPSLAKALECDPAYVIHMAMDQAVGITAAKSIMDIFGTPVTKNEAAWLPEIGDSSGNSNPRLTAQSRTALSGIFGK